MAANEGSRQRERGTSRSRSLGQHHQNPQPPAPDIQALMQPQSLQSLTATLHQLTQHLLACSPQEHSGQPPPATNDTFIADAKGITKLFKELPSNLQKRLIKAERLLEDRLSKLAKANDSLQKYDGPKADWHPTAKKLKDRDWQISKEELQFVSHYNVATTWESLKLKQAKEMHEFVIHSIKNQVQIFALLTSRDAYLQQVGDVVKEFCTEASKAYTGAERLDVQNVAKAWAPLSYKRIVTSTECKQSQKRSKRKNFEEQLAKAQSRLEGASMEEVLLTGLLEAVNVLRHPEPSDSGTNGVSAKLPEPVDQVLSGSTLGILAAKHPDVCKRYGLKVHDGLAVKSSRPSDAFSKSTRSHTSKSSSRQSSKHPSRQSSRKSRNSSRRSSRASSFASAQSCHSRASHRSKTSRSSRHSSRSTSRASSKSKASSRVTFRPRSRARSSSRNTRRRQPSKSASKGNQRKPKRSK